jgi:hypothetical protein
MRSVANREHQLAGLFVVIGASMVFGPVIWLLERWREALSRDPTSAWGAQWLGAQWLGEQLSAHPYLTLGALLLGVAFLGVLVMMILASVAKRLAARPLGRAHSS